MTSKTPETMRQPDSRWKVVRDLVVHVFRHNLGYKVLAVVLAIVLWAALITQDPTLTREKVFT